MDLVQDAQLKLRQVVENQQRSVPAGVTDDKQWIPGEAGGLPLYKQPEDRAKRLTNNVTRGVEPAQRSASSSSCHHRLLNCPLATAHSSPA